MLSNRYMPSVKNVPAIMKKMVEGEAPKKFNIAHLKGLGFNSSNDVGIIPALKSLGFLTADSTPTQRYLDYRDPSRSRQILADALREAYEDIFTINAKPTEADKEAVVGKFKAVHNVKENIAELQARLFFTLLKLADLDGKGAKPKAKEKEEREDGHEGKEEQGAALPSHGKGRTSLHYNIQVHLPATKDIEVYNAIFKSLKEHLYD